MDKLVNIFQNYAPLISTLISLITFGVGVYIGDRLAVSRDRRREYNAVTDMVRASLRDQCISLRDKQFKASGVTRQDVLNIADIVRKPLASAILSAYEDYTISIESGIAWRVVAGRRQSIDDASLAIASIERLLILIPRK